MSEPRRMLDEDASPLERALLESARADAPTQEGRARAALALGLAPPAALAPTLVGSLGVSKWAGGLVLLAALGAGTYYFAPRGKGSVEPAALGHAPVPQSARPRSNSLADGTGVAPRTTEAADAASAEPAEVAPAATANPSSTSSSSSTSSTSSTSSPTTTTPSSAASTARAAALSEQVARLEKSRALLASGQPRAALDELGRYRRDFPRGALSQEAFLLELEAWRAAGQASRASRAAEDFLRRYPSSPHADRVAGYVQR